MPRKTSKAPGVRRCITIGLCLPVSVTVEVERTVDGSWSPVTVRNARCEANAHNITEHMAPGDLDEFDRRCEAAKDLP